MQLNLTTDYAIRILICLKDTGNIMSGGEIAEQMKIPSHILEHVARRIIDAIRLRFPQCEKIRVKVSKLAPPLGGKIEKVSVTLEE